MARTGKPIQLGSIPWRFSCLRELLVSVGFRDVSMFSRFLLDNLCYGIKVNHVVVHAVI